MILLIIYFLVREPNKSDPIGIEPVHQLCFFWSDFALDLELILTSL